MVVRISCMVREQLSSKKTCQALKRAFKGYAGVPALAGAAKTGRVTD